MLAIRLQRTGRSGHAQYRMVVQESRLSPTSGKVVVSLGSYNPHTKDLTIDKEKAGFYLNNGAQPSPRVASLLKKDGIKLPSWVADPLKKERAVRNSDKLRKNRPAEEAPAEAPVEEAGEEPAEAPAEESAETEQSTDETTEA